MTTMEVANVSNVTGLSAEQRTLLEAPLDINLIKHRPGGGGKTLSYIKGKTAIDTANKIFGHGQWGYKILSRSHERTTDADGNITSEFYTADIELYVLGNPFPFPGDGIGIVIPPRNGSVAEAHEKARKEATTDALKRALRHYGSQFANDLYDEDAYVDAGDGALVQVKNVAQTKRQPPPQQTKHVVDAQGETQQTKHAQSPQDALKARLNTLYNRALELGEIDKSLTMEQKKARFLEIIGEACHANVTHADQITKSRLDTLEASLQGKVA